MVVEATKAAITLIEAVATKDSVAVEISTTVVGTTMVIKLTTEEGTKGTTIEVKVKSTGVDTILTIVVAIEAEATPHGAKTLRPSVMLTMSSLSETTEEVVIRTEAAIKVRTTVEVANGITKVTTRRRIIEARNSSGLRAQDVSITQTDPRHLSSLLTENTSILAW